MLKPTFLMALSAVLVSSIVGATPWTATPFSPPAIPLAVKSPYVSAWLMQGQGAALNDAWPNFWTGTILGWAGFANVDGASYCWMGVPAVPATVFNKAVQKSVQITATKTVFVMTAGPVDLTVTFLSPIEPSNLVNQSFPFSYYAISAASNDGQPHKVQVYADISGEWIAADTNLMMNWTSTTSTTTGDILTHELFLANQTPFTEKSQRVYQGSAYHSTINTVGTTYQVGADTDLRAQFINNSKLSNTLDTKFRAISDHWPVFAFAHDLGTVTAVTDPVVFSIGHARDPAVQYIILNGGTQNRSSYFWSAHPNIGDAIKIFLLDYSNALQRAGTFDSQIEADAKQISTDYASIVALSVRQAFGPLEITASKNGDGSYDTSNVLTFVKEISTGKVNTADAIYASWPMFLYASPDIAKQLLLPLLEYQVTSQYPHPWGVHDMGKNYPVADGYNDGQDDQMPVEESANMIIMSLSYTQRSHDTSLIKQYFSLLDQWGQYLVGNALAPGYQPNSDEFAGQLVNQTNLALKGVIGIKAMAQIADLLGKSDQSSKYNSIASSYLQQLQLLAVGGNQQHLTLTYGAEDSWGLMYNLYADKLVGGNFIPSSMYDMQTSWYSNNINAFGIPLDSRNTYTKTDWQMFVAATVTNNHLRDQIISAVLQYASDGQNARPFGDLYDTVNGTMVPSTNPFFARPVVGGHLALLALSGSTSSATSPGQGSPTATAPPSNDNGAGPNMMSVPVLGGVLHGLSVFVALIGFNALL
ncbi:DUF1793-domain-containing protein [Fomes fomentarius]|nr:DUF1793-domain-containing protein [Fomes fomentarius]